MGHQEPGKGARAAAAGRGTPAGGQGRTGVWGRRSCEGMSGVLLLGTRHLQARKKAEGEGADTGASVVR